MKILRAFVRGVDKFNVTVGRMASIGLPILVVVMVYEIIMRSFFDVSTHWSYDISIFLYGYTGLLAGAWVMKEQKHINVDIVQAVLSPRKQAITNVFSSFIVIFFLVILICSGSKLAMAAFKMGQRSPSLWGAPIAHFKAVIPAAAVMVLLQTVANMIRSLHLAVTGRPLDSVADNPQPVPTAASTSD